MDDIVSAAFARPFLSAAARDVWGACASEMGRAVLHGDAEPLFQNLEETARNEALVGGRDVEELLAGVEEGFAALRDALAASEGPDAEATLERLTALEREAAARFSTGYAAGLAETIARLQHRADECAPHDPVAGVLRVTDTLDRLAVEVERCRRTALSLGVLGVGVPPASPTGAGSGGAEAAAVHGVAETLVDNVRRYDGVGRTAEGDFLVVLPDVSRRSLVAIGERLRREVAGELEDTAKCVVALAHYDCVDVGAAEVMAAVERQVAGARATGETLSWV